MGALDCDMVGKNLLFFCMMLCFCGFVQAASNEGMAESAEKFQGKLCMSKWCYDLYEVVGFPIPGDVVVEKAPNNKRCFVDSSDAEFLENLLEFGKKVEGKLCAIMVRYDIYEAAGFPIPDDVVVKVLPDKRFLVASADGKFLESLRVFANKVREKLFTSKWYYDLYKEAGFPIPDDVVVEVLPNGKCCFVDSSNEAFLDNLYAYGRYRASMSYLDMITEYCEARETKKSAKKSSEEKEEDAG